MNSTKLIILLSPILLFFYLANKLSQAYRLAHGHDIGTKIINITESITTALTNPLPSLHTHDLIAGLIGAILITIYLQTKKANAKKYRKGTEHGSARWGTPNDIKPFIDPNFQNNVLLTKTERITMESRPKKPTYARNKNILVIGGAGSGKTRFFLKPNLMQMHSSYVVTDSKGTIILEAGELLKKGNYDIKVLNTINFAKSMKYNPFEYIRSEKDILKLVNTIIVNTKGEGEKATEDFWVKAERLYYSALIGYIFYEGQEDEKNFITFLDLVNASEAREDDENHKSPVDILFERLAEREPNHFAVLQYAKFKMAAGVVFS